MKITEKIAIKYLTERGFNVIKSLQKSKAPDCRLGMYGELDRVDTGKFELCMMSDKENESHLWVERIDEEGSEFYGKSVDELNEFLEKWFNKYF